MDPLSDVLDRARARGAVFALSELAAPWGLELEDVTPLSIHVALAGELWVSTDGVEPVHLLPGDIAVVRTDRSYVLSDAPDTPTRRLDEVGSWQLPGAPGRFANRTQRGPDDRRTLLLCGAYTFDGNLCGSLLDALPPVTPVRADLLERAGDVRPVVDLVLAELHRDEPGRSTVLDRLLDVLLVRVLRTALADAEHPPAWVLARTDDEVSAAIRLLHDDPARRWTVAELAAEVGLSRAALARRFTATVGVAPLAYLTDWRMRLAADALEGTRRSVADIAHEVGYANEFAFATAFKRWSGASPRAHRQALSA